jgi:GT2 family glycosyltransferase
MQQASVYSIIVTYNGMQWIERCLNSLIGSSYTNHIIVIDNGSKDKTILFIKEYYPQVQLIETGKNLGFGQGNNIGLKIAIEEKADYVFLLNQDARVEHDTIAQLVKAQTENPQFGIISPIHLNGTGNDFDDHFYMYFTRSEIKDLLSSSVFNMNDCPALINTPFVNAAAWLISNDCLKKTGGFDPVFFHYGEDDNYAHRVLFKGFKIGILTTAKIYHDKERFNPKTQAEMLRSKRKKDWIIFLDHACNIQRNDYKSLMVKRFLRCSCLSFFNFLTFNKSRGIYNFSMAKNIGCSFFKIRKSRAISVNNTMAHL